jgi:hypothetical protein
MGRIETCLDEILALRLGDERLQFGGGESINQTGFRDDEEEDLCTGKGGKFVCLFHDTWALRGRRVSDVGEEKRGGGWTDQLSFLRT